MTPAVSTSLAPRADGLPLPLAGEGGEGAAEVRPGSDCSLSNRRFPLPTLPRKRGRGSGDERGSEQTPHTTMSRTCFARAVQAPSRNARSVPVET
jgi:hypothetical protein